MKRFLITTLGCKVNQCESADLAHRLESSGYHPIEDNDNADLVIINTCTVTGRAAMQSRQELRRAIRKYPRAQIVVTGCLAQTAAEELRAIEGVDLIVGNAEKTEIGHLIDRMPVQGSTTVVRSDLHCAQAMSPLSSAAPEGRTRSFLKIQDGCNARCTYCIVPHARGRSRSMPATEVYDHLRRLSHAGFREVVLTGIHLGSYGTDFDTAIQLFDLIAQLPTDASVDRIRLSSIEPTEIDPRIVARMADAQGPLCPHFHVPLQSGADEILKRMGRTYSRSDYAQTIHAIHRTLPQAAIGADVLVGFPGEDEKAFRQTCDLIEELPLTYLHVFPFSARKGTPAAGFKGKVAEKIVKERCNYLRRLGEEKKRKFYHSLIGQIVMVLIETAADSKTGHSKGLSANYLPVSIDNSELLPNSLVPARIEKIDTDLTVWARAV